MLEALVYVSAANANVGQMDIDNILETARQNNYDIEVTGALVFSGSIFVQILEGSTQNLDRVMSKIEMDTRHVAVTVVVRESILERRFENWSMAYRSVNGLAAEELHSQFHWDSAIKKLLECLPSERSLKLLSENIAEIIDTQTH